MNHGTLLQRVFGVKPAPLSKAVLTTGKLEEIDPGDDTFQDVF